MVQVVGLQFTSLRIQFPPEEALTTATQLLFGNGPGAIGGGDSFGLGPQVGNLAELQALTGASCAGRASPHMDTRQA
jgi:hypothetical protein